MTFVMTFHAPRLTKCLGTRKIPSDRRGRNDRPRGFFTIFLSPDTVGLMASIYKDPRGRSPYWYVAYRTSKGQLIRRSTKHTERKKAWEVARNVEQAETEAANGRLHQGRVRELISEVLERTMDHPVRETTVRDWFINWLAEKESDGSLSANSRIAYQASIRLFLQHLGKSADNDLTRIQAEDIQKFKQSRISIGLSAKTIDRDLKVLRSVLKQARLHGHIDKDPALLVPLLTKQNKRIVQTVTRQTFSAAELDTLTTSASGEWKTVILLARYIGARQGDCVRMCWENIDLAERVLRYSDAKTHKSYTIPIHRRLAAHLQMLAKAGASDGLLCPALSGKPSGGKYGLSMEFRRIMATAGIDDRSVATKAVRADTSRVRHLARRSFHSIRHSYNTELANTGTSQEIRRGLLGHSDADINDRYTHMDVSAFREAVDRLA